MKHVHLWLLWLSFSLSLVVFSFCFFLSLQQHNIYSTIRSPGACLVATTRHPSVMYHMSLNWVDLFFHLSLSPRHWELGQIVEWRLVRTLPGLTTKRWRNDELKGHLTLSAYKLHSNHMFFREGVEIDWAGQWESRLSVREEIGWVRQRESGLKCERG
jgi:hypothetical protein